MATKAKRPKRKKKLTEEQKTTRLRNREERATRQRKVLHLRFVKRWNQYDIAVALDICTATVMRDIKSAGRKLRKEAMDNLEYEMRDIAEKLKLANDEIVKLLWNDYDKVNIEAQTIYKELQALAEGPHAKDELAIIAITEKQDLFSSLISKGRSILAQITTTDDSFVEQMRKLGLVKGELDVDDDGDGSFLLEIRARKARIDDIHKKSSGQPPDKPSAPAGGKT